MKSGFTVHIRNVYFSSIERVPLESRCYKNYKIITLVLPQRKGKHSTDFENFCLNCLEFLFVIYYNPTLQLFWLNFSCTTTLFSQECLSSFKIYDTFMKLACYYSSKLHCECGFIFILV